MPLVSCHTLLGQVIIQRASNGRISQVMEPVAKDGSTGVGNALRTVWLVGKVEECCWILGGLLQPMMILTGAGARYQGWQHKSWRCDSQEGTLPGGRAAAAAIYACICNPQAFQGEILIQ